MIKVQENEQLVISNLMKSKSFRIYWYARVSNPAEYFTTKECQSLFLVIKRLHRGRKEITVESVNSFCKSVDFTTIKDLYEKFDIIDESNYESYLSVLKENTLEFDIQEKMLPSLIGEMDDLETLQDKIQILSDITSVVKKRYNDQSRTAVKMSTLIDDYKIELKSREDGKEFYTTGDHRLDARLVYGFAPGEITSVCGRPQNGKSLYSQYLSRNLTNVGVPVLSINCEMRSIGILDRLVSMGTQIDATRLVKYVDELDQHEREVLEMEMGRLASDNPFYYYNAVGKSMEDCFDVVKQVQDETGAGNLVVTWDLLMKLSEFTNSESAKDVQNACDKLQVATEELGIHSIPLLQINREGDKDRLNKPDDVYKIYPNYSQIKYSGAFEEVSDNILLICNPAFYLNRYEWGQHVPSYLRVEIAKRRGGVVKDQSTVLLYKTNNNHFGLIEPEDGWDPLELQISDDDLDDFTWKNN